MPKRRALRKYVFIAINALAVSVSAAVIPISSFDQLRAVSEGRAGFPLNGDYELAGDIDAAASRQKTFSPIGTADKPFTGKFDGKGFAVRGLYVNRPSAGHSGLFGYVGPAGRVSSLGVIDANVSGSFAVGALAGTNTGSINQCYSSGSVSGLRQESNAGGLVGVNGGAVEKSYSAAAVKGFDQIGGLAGFLTVITEGRIAECYATGSVSGNKSVGGLVGYAFGGSISKSFAMGAVSARSGGAGGLVGAEFTSANPQYNTMGQVGGSGGFVKPASIVNCFWDINTSGLSTSATASGATGSGGKTSREMRQRSTYENAGWDFKSADGWTITDGGFYPQIKSLPLDTITYTVAAGSSGNGRLMVQGAGGTSKEYKITVSAGVAIPAVTAVPDDGCHFVNWSEDNSTRAARADTAKGNNARYTAVFAYNAIPIQFNYFSLSYESAGNGRLIVNRDAGNPRIAYAAMLLEGVEGPVITAVPNRNYLFYGWSDGFPEPSRTDFAEKDLAVTAYFVLDPSAGIGPDRDSLFTGTHRLIYTAVGNGKLRIGASLQDIDGPCTLTVEDGQKVRVEAIADAGYKFAGWGDGITTAARIDTATESIKITAYFTEREDFTIIGTYDDLRDIGNKDYYPLDGKYELTKDIDASASKNPGIEFTPIGNAAAKFTGKFRGNGHTIKNLRVDSPGADNIGLFGYTDGADITGVRLDSVDITGRYNVGGLVGYALNTLIDSCGVGGSVKGDSTVGGLVGYYQSDSGALSKKVLTNSFSTANVAGVATTVRSTFGGLAGRLLNARVKSCYSTGMVMQSGGSVTNMDFLGGLVGRSERHNILECYATGTVALEAGSRNEGPGGLVGNAAYGNIMDCYSTGDVLAPLRSTVGGLIGMSNGRVTRCYSAGVVQSRNDNGAMFGGTNTSHISSLCYYDNEKTTKTDTYGGAIGKTTEEMYKAETYEGWFINIPGGKWAIDEGNGYPYLISLGKTVYPLSKERVPAQRPQAQSATQAHVRGKTLVITAAQPSGVQVRFYDLRGKVTARYATQGSAKISLQRVPSGRYIMELREAKSKKRLSVSTVVVR